jgi:eukaryotic-like serine/threonine-protein kinase
MNGGGIELKQAEASACPAFTRVVGFVRGELSGFEVLELEAHIDSCDACFSMIAQMAAGDDASSSKPRQAWQEVAVRAAESWASTPSSPLELPSRVGERIAGYRLEGILGRGGMGVVYRARREGANEAVALKTIGAPSPQRLASLREEIAYLESVRHDGIIEILEHGLYEGAPWYSMPLLEGVTLAERHHAVFGGLRRKPTSGIVERRSEAQGRALAEARAKWLTEVRQIYARLCAPIAHLHAAGMVHCDLKPANVFLQSDGRPILIDFGLISLARGTVSRETLQVTGLLRGTLPYLAPELILGKIPDSRADLYSLGCMLHESVTGRPPFESTDVRQLLDMHLGSVAAPASTLAPDVPEDLAQLIARLLAKVPSERPRRTEDVAAALEPGRVPEISQASSAPYLFRSKLVGRDETLRELVALQKRALAGTGSMILVAGESGIGKTFLASEFAQLSSRVGFDVIVGECRPIAATRDASVRVAGDALEPLRKWLQRLADVCRSDGPEMTARIFDSPLTIRILAAFEPSLTSILNSLGEEAPDELPPLAARERVLAALTETLERTAWTRPLLLVLDDLQWADDLTLAFLSNLSARTFQGRQLMLLGTYRDTESSEQLSQLGKKRWVRQFVLEPLAPADLDAMMQDMLASRAPEPLLEIARKASAGNPFLVAEYLRTIASRMVVRRDTDQYELTSDADQVIAAGALPATIGELLRNRLPAPGTAHLTVQACAVLGRECSPEILESVTELTASEVTAGVQELVNRRVVERVADGSVRFIHDKIRETAYAEIEVALKSGLHRRAAEALIREAPHGTRERANLLAHHYSSSGDHPLALEYLDQAAGHALQRFAYADVILYLKQATTLSETASIELDLVRRARWQRELGDALQGLGDMPGAKAPLLRSLEVLGRRIPSSSFGIVLGILAAILRQLWQRVVPRTKARSPAVALQTIEAARAYDRLQRSFYFGGEYGSLLLANLSTLSLPKANMPAQELALAYTNAGATAGVIPLPKLCDFYFALAEAIVAEKYDLESDTYRRNAHAIYLLGIGAWDKAFVASETSAQAAAAARYSRRFEEATGVYALVAIAKGDFELAWAWNEKSLASAEPRGDTQMLSWGWLNRLLMQLHRGELDAAVATTADLAGIIEKISRPERIAALCLQGALRWRRGERAEALALIRNGLELAAIERSINPIFEPFSQAAFVLSEALQEPGARSPELKRQLDATCRILRKAARSFPVAFPRYALHEGSRLQALGRASRARALWRAGLERARALAMTRDAALLEAVAAKASSQEPV